MKFKTDTLGELLFRVRRGDPKRDQKRVLRNAGGKGDAPELESVLASDAMSRRTVIAEADRLQAEFEQQDKVCKLLEPIREACKASGLTQTQLATLGDTSQKSISEYLNGGTCNPVTLENLAGAMGAKLKIPVAVGRRMKAALSQ